MTIIIKRLIAVFTLVCFFQAIIIAQPPSSNNAETSSVEQENEEGENTESAPAIDPLSKETEEKVEQTLIKENENEKKTQAPMPINTNKNKRKAFKVKTKERRNANHPFNDYITDAYLKDVIEALTSKTFAGRSMDTRGQRLTSAFLNYELEKMGYKGLYDKSLIQLVKYDELVGIKSTLQTKKNTYTYGKDFFYLSPQTTEDGSASLTEDYNLIYGGNGNIEDVKMVVNSKINPKLKNALIIYPNNYINVEEIILQTINPEVIQLVVVVAKANEWTKYMTLENKVNLKENMDYTLQTDQTSRLNIPIICISSKMFDAEYGIADNSNFKAYMNNTPAHNFNVQKVNSVVVKFSSYFESNNLYFGNLVAVTPNFDVNKSNIIVLCNSDYVNSIKNIQGANHNASGVAATLSIANALMNKVLDGISLEKNVIFIFTNAKFRNNMGAKYYSQYPLLPLVKTFAVVEISGIGKPISKIPNAPPASNTQNLYALINQEKDKTWESFIKTNLISPLFPVSVDFSLSLQKSWDALIYRTDAWSFGKFNVPFIVLTDGSLDETINTNITDAVDGINYPLLLTRSQFIGSFIFKLATDPATLPKIIPNHKFNFYLDFLENKLRLSE